MKRRLSYRKHNFESVCVTLTLFSCTFYHLLEGTKVTQIDTQWPLSLRHSNSTGGYNCSVTNSGQVHQTEMILNPKSQFGVEHIGLYHSSLLPDSKLVS